MSKLALKDVLAALAELSDEDRKSLAGELMPVVAIKPAVPTVAAYSSQKAENGETTSIHVAVKHDKRVADAYRGPGFYYAILSHGDDVALACADAVTEFPSGKLAEGTASWEAAFTSLAEVLAPVLSDWRKQFAVKAK